MRVMRLGSVLFAVGLAGLGVLSLVFGDFVEVWQSAPRWVPWRAPLAFASGLMLMAGAVGMLLPRTARLAALVLTADLLLWLVVLQLPLAVAHAGTEVVWESCGEAMIMAAGAWILLASLPAAAPRPGLPAAPPAPGAAGERSARLARILYGLALLPIGLSHFVYLKLTASLVPAWLPWHTGFAYLTGAGHLAAGLAILFAVLPRLAATAEAAMLGIFTLLVWLPAIGTAPVNREAWSELFSSAAMTGAAWMIAASLQDTPRWDWWGTARRAARRGASSHPPA